MIGRTSFHPHLARRVLALAMCWLLLVFVQAQPLSALAAGTLSNLTPICTGQGLKLVPIPAEQPARPQHDCLLHCLTGSPDRDLALPVSDHGTTVAYIAAGSPIRQPETVASEGVAVEPRSARGPPPLSSTV